MPRLVWIHLFSVVFVVKSNFGIFKVPFKCCRLGFFLASLWTILIGCLAEVFWGTIQMDWPAFLIWFLSFHVFFHLGGYIAVLVVFISLLPKNVPFVCMYVEELLQFLLYFGIEILEIVALLIYVADACFFLTAPSPKAPFCCLHNWFYG